MKRVEEIKQKCQGKFVMSRLKKNKYRKLRTSKKSIKTFSSSGPLSMQRKQREDKQAQKLQEQFDVEVVSESLTV